MDGAAARRADAARGVPASAAFLAGFVALDFFAYAVHMLMHRVPWMWPYHRVHHCASSVDVTTTFRQHPGETLFRFACTSVPAILLGMSSTATAAYRLVSGVSALFEHANIRVAPWLDRGLRWFVVTLCMHKIHLSRLRLETDSN